MKTTSFAKFAQSVVVLAMAAVASSPALADSTWGFSDTGSINCNTGELASCAAQDGSNNYVKVSAFSVASSAGAKFAAGTATVWPGGIGVSYTGESSGSPQHSTDNSGQTDAILLDFGKTNLVDLSNIKIGWKGDSTGAENTNKSDADISVFAYTGTVDAGANWAPTIANSLTVAGMAAAGWTLVGNYADLAENTSKAVNVTTNLQSSWWLISAYNSSYVVPASGVDPNSTVGAGTISGNSVAGLQAGNDYFKVLSVAGSVTHQTPEPSSLALVGVALIGFVAKGRRKQQAA